jgi:hypothetical protein
VPGTYKKIDYRLRPAKHAERMMLIDLFRRMRFAPIETYQYVGFGSVAFVDFRMVHKALGIKELISIEAATDDDERARFERNKPYAGLNIHFGRSSAVLPTLDFAKRSLVWLDYDGPLSRSMANDLAAICRSVHSGSFVCATFAAAFPTKSEDRAAELKRLREDFPDFLSEQAKAQDLDGPKLWEFGRRTLGALLEKAVSDADAGQPAPKRRKVRQVCYFTYRDGLPMATVGWVVAAEEEAASFEACHFEGLSFFRDASNPFRIAIPLITPFEVGEMERRLPHLDDALDLNWIPETERRNFSEVHRYLPHFSVVETS